MVDCFLAATFPTPLRVAAERQEIELGEAWRSFKINKKPVTISEQVPDHLSTMDDDASCLVGEGVCCQVAVTSQRGGMQAAADHALPAQRGC